MLTESRPQSPQQQLESQALPSYGAHLKFSPDNNTPGPLGEMTPEDVKRYQYYYDTAVDTAHLGSDRENFLDFDPASNQPTLRPTRENVEKLLSFRIEPETALHAVRASCREEIAANYTNAMRTVIIEYILQVSRIKNPASIYIQTRKQSLMF